VTVTPDLTVDRDSDIPLGTQLAWKLRTAIATGRLAPGERVPPVRELAEVAGVNVNTARSVYARLEEQGLVASEHGRGTFVAADAARRDDLADLARKTAEAARAAGVDPRELGEALFSGSDVEGPPPEREAEPKPSDERARRRELRADIARLERELVHLARLGDAAAMPSAPAGRILNAQELEEVRTALVARLAELRRDREDALHRTPDDELALAPDAEPRYRDAGIWTGPAARVAWTS
jgi:GntR family transcriptional regulator